MSLFENEAYQWRETFFILFRDSDQPTAADIEEALKAIDSGYVIRNIQADEASLFESLTLEAADDYSAMDISLVKGDEVLEQTLELIKELLANTADADERRKIKQLESYRSRYEVYHFEQLVFVGREQEDQEGDDFLDPGAVLTVMQIIAEMCNGVVVDPQAYAIL